MKRVDAYTDGACSGNPGPGGYAVILRWNGHERELSRGFRRTTNNRMEILAVIAAIESPTEPCELVIHSDSQYVVNAIQQGWAKKWRANGWMRNRKEPALNPDLWERLLDLLGRSGHKVRFVWVRGHDGHDENERADRLAVAACRSPEPLIDEGYERGA
ncbi:MAG: ribonuclease HI [Thermoanaerobaculia bacterium]|jgi:ribonuclease HI|nr:MAG: ribonuclease HI [Thermoanaerobaculia bacterium]MBZ0100722.1 ribonuclease HI [Thermoanaerobaculia bacterium]